MRGPASFSTNEMAALLVEGFDRPATIMMPYNPEYYVDLIENSGCRSRPWIWWPTTWTTTCLRTSCSSGRSGSSKRLDVSLRTLAERGFLRRA